MEIKNKIGIFFVLTILTIILIVGCTDQNVSKNDKNQIGDITISSSAFVSGGIIPVKYTCDGDDITPPLDFNYVPNGTKSLVLILEDPDASGGTWVHWIVFNIPPDIKGFKENEGPRYYIGENSWGDIGYGGPCPPIGEQHRYYFRLYALNTELNLLDGASRKEIDDAMEGHIIGKTSLMGKYGS
jgi:Raf kinase inhibitor-like YbhB/YbcL family protein